MEKKYYLNNYGNGAITIQLTAKRTIDAHKSLPLNNKDVLIFKELKAKRRNGFLNDLRLSTFPIEDDARFAKVDKAKDAAKKEAEEKAKKEAEELAKKEAEENAKKEAEEKAKKEAEELAKKEAEEKAKGKQNK